MESLIYSDTRLGRLKKCPLTMPSTPDPVYGRSIFRHGITTIRTCVHNYRYANRLTIRKSGFYLYETDMLKSGVKPSIRRTGAEIIDFLVFGYFTGQIVAKNGMK